MIGRVAAHGELGTVELQHEPRLCYAMQQSAVPWLHALRLTNDGEEALAEVQQSEPDVMLLDLHMPRMNGVELCMQLKGEGLAQSCSIISVSAGAQEHDVQILHQLGIHHFVEKGSNLRERLRTVFIEVCGDQVLADG